MAVQRERREQEHDDGGGGDDFTFPTPPQPQRFPNNGKDFHHLPCSASASSSPPLWLLSSSPIRRSFSAADCAASPWRARVLLSRHRLNGASSPALSDYAAGFCDDEEEEEEERMDSLWEDLNDADAGNNGDDLFPGSLHVSRRRSVAGPGAAERAAPKVDRRDAAAAPVLGASRSSRRRQPGLVVMMRALKRMFVAHKGKSRVHRDEQSTASVSSCTSNNTSNKR